MAGAIIEDELNRLQQKVLQLEEENQKLKTLLTKTEITDALVIVDHHGSIIKINEAFCNILGRPDYEILGRPLTIFIKNEVEVPSQKNDMFIRLTDNNLRLRCSLYKLNDLYTIYQLYIDSKHQHKEDVTILSMVMGVLDKIGEGFIVFNELGIIKDANKAFCTETLLMKDVIVGKNFKDYVPDKFKSQLTTFWDNLTKAGKVNGILPIVINGNTSYFEFSASRFTGNMYICGLRDVSEKRLFERKIRRNGELFTDLFLEAIDGIVFWGSDGRIINANDAACRIFESSREELLERKVDDFVFEKDSCYYQIVKDLQKNGAIRNELLFLMPNGQKKYLEFTSKLHAVDGYHMTILRNVSERHRMEEELRESELKFRKIFEGSIEGMILSDNKFHIIDINQSALAKLEQSKSDILGTKINSLLEKSNVPKQEIEKRLEQLKNDGKISGRISLNITSDKLKHFEFSTKYNLFANFNLTVFRDITEKFELEEQLRKSDTLNVIGELAAGIAHEIRNPMTSLKGFIQLLQGDMAKEHEMYFQVITTELKRIDSIINEFLMLAKPQVVRFSEVNISQIMKETVSFMNAQAVLHNVQFKQSYDNELPEIFCEPNQLKKVFINIIKNAIEAMPKGGYISVCVTHSNEKFILVTIKDEGVGIPKEKIRKLGEPFYTTKDRGTGLGLMVSYKIIEEQKGKIVVESSESVGTTFKIFLPLNNRKEQEK